jgi:hypothetical protein
MVWGVVSYVLEGERVLKKGFVARVFPFVVVFRVFGSK